MDPRYAHALSALCALSVACASTGTQTSPERDAEVAAEFEGIWTAHLAQGELTLNVCEDTSAVGSGHTCETRHVVRRASPEPAERIDLEPGGCGGCVFDVAAIYAGTLTYPGSEALPVQMSVVLATRNKDNLYDGDYRVEVRGADSVQDRFVNLEGDFFQGSIVSASLRVQSRVGTAVAPRNDTGFGLERTEASGCPR